MSHTPPAAEPPLGGPPARPKRRRTGLIVAVAVAGTALLLCGSCGAVALVAAGDNNGGPTKTKSQSPSVVESDDAPSPTPPEEPDASDRTAAIGSGDGFSYTDGLQVQVTSATKFRISSAAAGGTPGQQGVKVVVKITNGSTSTVDLALTLVTLSAGDEGLQADSVFDVDLGTGFDGTVTPGKTRSAEFGFAVDKKDLGSVQVEVEPGSTYEGVTFVGAVS